MDCQENSSILILRSFTDHYIYWTIIPVYLFGVFLNAIFIYITIVEAKRNKSTDYTITILCCTELCNAITSIIKATYVNANKESYHDLQVWFPVFDTLDFIYDGVYICLLIFLNATRLQVMKNIKEVRNSRIKRSKRWQWILPLFYATFLCCYGIMSFLELPEMYSRYIKLGLHVMVLGFPWILLLVLHFLMMVCTLSTIYKRRKVYTITQTQPNDKNMDQTSIRASVSKPDVANKLIHQVFSSLLFQTFCIVLPHSYNVATNFLCLPLNTWYQFLSVCLVRSLKPFLNPVGLGLFLKQRRDNLAKFIETISVTDQYNSRRMAVIENDYKKNSISEIESECVKVGVPAEEQENIDQHNFVSKTIMKNDAANETGLHVYKNGQLLITTCAKNYLSDICAIGAGRIESDYSSLSDVSDEGSMKYSSCSSFDGKRGGLFFEKSGQTFKGPSTPGRTRSVPNTGGNTLCVGQGGKAKKVSLTTNFSSIQEQFENDSEDLSDVSADGSVKYNSSCGSFNGNRLSSLLHNRQERATVYSTYPINETAVKIDGGKLSNIISPKRGQFTRKHSVGLLSHTNSTISAVSVASTIQDTISYF